MLQVVCRVLQEAVYMYSGIKCMVIFCMRFNIAIFCVLEAAGRTFSKVHGINYLIIIAFWELLVLTCLQFVIYLFKKL